MRKNLESIHNVVIGTAGHIDHGKTTLVEKLTGINPDRLPEEKERGMTIDLGFARLQLPGGLRVGIVDVPGHERFVKNMVAGATGIDLVLLVVAADDGVMPQTLEHLEIMSLLDLRHGLIALTKIDLVEPELRDLALEDIREAVKGTFLQDAPVVPVSSATGEGIPRLREILCEKILNVPPRDSSGVFRMPIQRVFSSKGFGTVLTGIPVSGRVQAGDPLEVVPIGKEGRVRGIHAYGEPVDMARAGHSSAINITDVDYKEVRRGMVLAQPGYFEAARMVEARFRYLARARRPLEHLTTVRFHTGTAEVIGRIHILEKKALEPGESCLVQFRLDEPAVVAPGDRFVARLHSPMETIGGGEVLGRSRWRLKAGKPLVIDSLRRKEEALGSPEKFLRNLFAEAGLAAVSEQEAAVRAGLPLPEAREALERLIAGGALLRSSRPGLLISRQRFEDARTRAIQEAERYFRENPRKLLMEKLHLRNFLRAQDVFFQDLLQALEAQGIARTVGGEHLQWAAHRPALSPKESEAREKLLEAYRAAPFAPPGPEEAARAAGIGEEAARALTKLLLEEGELVKVSEEILFHREALEEARRRLREHLLQEKAMTASSAKTILASSRKYIIPLLEFLDREGFTIRRGDLRELRIKEKE